MLIKKGLANYNKEDYNRWKCHYFTTEGFVWF